MNAFIQLQGLFRRETARYFAVPLQTLGAPIVNAILYLMIFGVSLGKSIEVGSQVSYLAFLIPGLIAMSVIRNAFENSTSAIIGAKYVNELQDLRIVPMSIRQISWAKSLSSLSRGLLVGLITYFVGQIFYLIWGGSWLSMSHPLALLYFLSVGGLSFGFLGVAIGMSAKSFEHVGAVSSLIILPLTYLGGVFFTFENLDPLWQKISLFNPLFYIINGSRYGFLGITDISLTLSGLVAFLFLAISYFWANMTLKKGSNYLR